jgi:hypothetical protein
MILGIILHSQSTTMKQTKDIFYQMFIIENDELDMEDLRVMWEAFLIQRNISIPDNWDRFIDHINSVASDNFEHFSQVFDIYFIN